MACIKALGWKSGLAFIIIGCILIAGGIIAGQLVTLGLKKGFQDYTVYKADSKFKDPSYEKCDNKTLNVWFFNMTNAEDLRTGATNIPNYVQVGPYNFTREACEFGNRAEGDWEYYRKYWKTPHLVEAGPGLSADDLIVNFNPAYLGILREIEKRGAPPGTEETALIAQLTGGALEQIIEGFQSPTFTDQVVVGGIPTFLLGVRTEVLPQVQASVTAGFVLLTIDSTLTSLIGQGMNQSEAIDAFFNDVNVPNGVSNWATTSLGISPESQNLILFGTGAPIGWFNDTTRATGFLAFLQTIQNSTQSGVYFTQSQLSDPNQLLALGGYAGYMFNTFAPANFPGGVAGINAKAEATFYDLWTNSTTGLDLNSDGIGFDGWEIGTNFDTFTIAPTGITLDAAEALYDPTILDSLTNLTGIAKWFTAAQAAKAGNMTPAVILATEFGLSVPAQLTFVLNYLGNLHSKVMPVLLFQQFGVSSFDELGYLQWGTANVLLGASAKQYDPTIPAEPEFGWYAHNTLNLPALSFDGIRSEELLNGTYGFFRGENIAEFLGLMQAAQVDPTVFNLINAKWGLSPTEAGPLAMYFNYFFSDFIDPLMLGQMIPQGAGPITRRTPADWIWTGVDPLLTFIGQPDNVGLLYSSSDALSHTEAANQTPERSRPIFHGGSAEERKSAEEVKRYPDYPPGNETIVGVWQSPLKVHGNYDGVYWPPGVKKGDTLTVWLDELVRPVDAVFWKKSVVKGINVWLFRIVDSTWSENPFYFQPEGRCNLTSTKPIKLFLTRPHFYGVPDDDIQNGVTGLKPMSDEFFTNQYFAVEPESGIAMLRVAPFQANFEVPAMDRYYAGLNKTIFAPGLFSDYREIIPDDDADEFKRLVGGAKAGIIVSYVVGISLGAISLAFGIFVCVKWNQRRVRGEESNIEVELPSK